MPDAVTGVAPPTPSTVNYGTTAKPATDAAENKDLFLNLMVAQLRYQNPLEPTSGTEFMAQTAQFTMVESLQKLTELSTDTSRWSRMALAQDMVGRTVEVTDPVSGRTLTGTVGSVRSTIDGPVLSVTGPEGTGDVVLEDIAKVLGGPLPEPVETTG